MRNEMKKQEAEELERLKKECDLSFKEMCKKIHDLHEYIMNELKKEEETE